MPKTCAYRKLLTSAKYGWPRPTIPEPALLYLNTACYSWPRHTIQWQNPAPEEICWHKQNIVDYVLLCLTTPYYSMAKTWANRNLLPRAKYGGHRSTIPDHALLSKGKTLRSSKTADVNKIWCSPSCYTWPRPTIQWQKTAPIENSWHQENTVDHVLQYLISPYSTMAKTCAYRILLALAIYVGPHHTIPDPDLLYDGKNLRLYPHSL